MQLFSRIESSSINTEKIMNADLFVVLAVLAVCFILHRRQVARNRTLALEHYENQRLTAYHAPHTDTRVENSRERSADLVWHAGIEGGKK